MIARSGIETIGIPREIFIRKPRIVAPFFSISFSCRSRPFYRVDTLYKIDPCSASFFFLFRSLSLSFFFLRTNINFPQAWKIDSESFIQPVVVVSDKFFIANKECLVRLVRGTKMSGQILDEIRFREIWSWHNLRLMRISFSVFSVKVFLLFCLLYAKLYIVSLNDGKNLGKISK